MRFSKKYLYQIQLGFQRKGQTAVCDYNCMVVVGTKSLSAAVAKAKSVIINYPGQRAPFINRAEVYSALLKEEVY